MLKKNEERYKVPEQEGICAWSHILTYSISAYLALSLLLLPCLVQQLENPLWKVLLFKGSISVFVRVHLDDSFFEKRIHFFWRKHVTKRNWRPLWPNLVKCREESRDVIRLFAIIVSISPFLNHKNITLSLYSYSKAASLSFYRSFSSFVNWFLKVSRLSWMSLLKNYSLWLGESKLKKLSYFVAWGGVFTGVGILIGFAWSLVFGFVGGGGLFIWLGLGVGFEAGLLLLGWDVLEGCCGWIKSLGALYAVWSWPFWMWWVPLIISALFNFSMWNSLLCWAYLNFRILMKMEPLTCGTLAFKLLMSIQAVLKLEDELHFFIPFHHFWLESEVIKSVVQVQGQNLQYIFYSDLSDSSNTGWVLLEREVTFCSLLLSSCLSECIPGNDRRPALCYE